jgi:hypothetical protein
MANPDLNVDYPHPVGLPNPYPFKSNPIKKILPPPILPTDEELKESEREEVEYLDQLLTEEWDYYHLGYFDFDRI